MLCFFIKSFLLGPNAGTQLVDLFRLSLDKVSANVLSYRLNQITNLSISKQKCDVKALYIQADDDYLVPERCVETFKEVMENLEIYQLSGPHLILQANPLESSEIIIDQEELNPQTLLDVIERLETEREVMCAQMERAPSTDVYATGTVDFGGVRKQVSLCYVPEAKVGDYVLVHVGLALSVVDPEEAARVFDYLEEIGELEELTSPRAEGST